MYIRTSKRIVLLLLAFIMLLGGCSQPEAGVSSAPISAPAAEETAVPEPAAESPSVILTITELMPRNHATLRDRYGDFPDWIEIRNDSGTDVNLDGWSLSDRKNRDGLVFPAFLFPSGSTFVVYASGKDRPEELHAPFSLSAEETLFLRDPNGNTVSKVICPDLPDDRSWALHDDGSWAECLYPTPWRENSAASYDAWQEEIVITSPLVQNEVTVSDPNASFSPDLGGSDWVELKNTSAAPMNLAGWDL